MFFGKKAELGRSSVDVSDEELMEAWKNGYEEAFSRLYHRYHKKIFGYLMNRMRSESKAQEVFQDVYMKLHRNRTKYDKKYPFRPWLFTIVRNAMIDAIRSNRQSGFVEFQEEIHSQTTVVPKETQISFNDVNGFNALPERQRRAITMKYSEDLSFLEIAEHLNTSEGNVRQIISRAIKRLRKIAFANEGNNKGNKEAS